jgi:hypothetical protein
VTFNTPQWSFCLNNESKENKNQKRMIKMQHDEKNAEKLQAFCRNDKHSPRQIKRLRAASSDSFWGAPLVVAFGQR